MEEDIIIGRRSNEAEDQSASILGPLMGSLIQIESVMLLFMFPFICLEVCVAVCSRGLESMMSQLFKLEPFSSNFKLITLQ